MLYKNKFYFLLAFPEKCCILYVEKQEMKPSINTKEHRDRKDNPYYNLLKEGVEVIPIEDDYSEDSWPNSKDDWPNSKSRKY